MKTASAAQEHPPLDLAVSYGPQFVSPGLAEDPQAPTPAVEGGHEDHIIRFHKQVAKNLLWVS